MLRQFIAIGLLMCYLAQVSSVELSFQDSIRLMSTDTFLVHEVSVVSSVSGKFQAGQHSENFSEKLIGTIGSGNLTDLISRFSPIYIKSDAGGLSTIRVRGTSPDHTAIYFGGLNINSLTLGHSNMSNIPTYLFDNISLQYGSSSAENGSGSIGGSIRLGLDNRWTDGYNIEAYGEVGSFGRNMQGAKVFLGNGKWESVTRFQNFYLHNNFPFWNTDYHDFESDNGYQRDVQRFSAVTNLHLIQELKYRFSNKEFISGMVWVSNSRHQAQPNMTKNKGKSLTAEEYQSKDVRVWAKYTNNKGRINYYVGMGGVSDNAVNLLVDTQSIKTKRFVSEVEISQKLAYNFNYKAGLKYKRIVPEVYAYQEGYVEEHLDLYASFHKQLFQRLNVSLNFRQQYVTGFKAPFTPSLGAEYLLINASHYSLKVLGNVSRSYRIPTFNDRFWIPGGNPNLKPEDGRNCELGAKYAFCGSAFTLNVGSQFFYHDIDQWLMWIQGSNGWEASNVTHVISKGIELHVDLTTNLGNVTTNAGANFTYNPVVRKESVVGSDKLNTQLEYTPKHIGNIWLGTQYKAYEFTLDASFTGERSYNQIGGVLSPYTLVNANAFYSFKIKGHKFKVNASIKNIFSESYQNQFLYAMPEVSFLIGLKYKLKGNY